MARLRPGERIGDRYEVRRMLGQGGMGVVYEGWDRRRRARVAIKTMREVDPVALYRLKNEFRALADVSHPNLVTLHDLESIGGRTFITMEYVFGRHLLEHLRGEPTAREHTTSVGDETFVSVSGDTVSCTMNLPLGSLPRLAARTASADESGERPSIRQCVLREAFAQIVEAVSALHQGGRLHRDLKPSNVLVTPAGRVVVLDFGVVSTLGGESNESLERNIVGTPRYMSPEQALAQELTSASDWYAVGVMLYEALAGAPPFEGSLFQVLVAKNTAAPAPLPASVPSDLASLCLDLLQRDPARRPGPEEILARLGADRLRRVSFATHSLRPASTFVGRERHLAALSESFHAAASGRPALTFVRGSSGMGKSLLVQRFVEQLGEEPLVLSGRCYERDSVPFKALDSVVDALSRHLRHLDREELEGLLPGDVHALCKLFPVLGRVEAIQMSRRTRTLAADPHEVRRRAAAAFRGLLAALAARRPVVVWMDDLQWADLDSAALVAELVHAPGVLWIASYRSDHPVTPLVAALREPHDDEGCVVDLEVGTLEHEDAERLAAELLAGHRDVRRLAPIIALESRGSPFFVEELVHAARAGELPSKTGRLLSEVLLSRVGTLPHEAARLLEIVALAGRPIALSPALEAARIDAERDMATLSLLRNARLLRASRDVLDTYHDSIRETVVRSLDAGARTRLHLRIALALVANGSTDPEVLVEHFREAGERTMAAEHAANAATRAAAAFAFDRAAALWRVALDLGELSESTRSVLLTRMGDALACAGRGEEAARAYDAATLGATPPEVVELRRRAAEQLLRRGRIAEGMAAIDEVMASVRMELPSHPLLVVAALVFYDLLLRIRGLSHRQRDPSQISAAELTRIDICWSVGATLAIVKPIYAKIYQKRHLLLALKAGDVRRIARAVTLEGMSCSTGGSRSRGRTAHLLGAANAQTRSLKDPYSSALLLGAEGISAYFEGRFRAALERCELAAERMSGLAENRSWEQATATMVSIWSLFQMGDMNRLSQRVTSQAQQARLRGDRYLSTNVRIGMGNATWLAADDPARAEAELDDAMASWGSAEQQVQRYHELLARVNIALYRDDPSAALREVDARWNGLERANLLRVQSVRLGLLHLRARAHLAAASRSSFGERERALRAARAVIRRLRRDDVPWGRALTALTEAGLYATSGDEARACGLLSKAIVGFEACDMRLWAACARRRLGELTGSASMIAEADASARALGVRAPESFARVLAPGFGR